MQTEVTKIHTTKQRPLNPRSSHNLIKFSNVSSVSKEPGCRLTCHRPKTAGFLVLLKVMPESVAGIEHWAILQSTSPQALFRKEDPILPQHWLSSIYISSGPATSVEHRSQSQRCAKETGFAWAKKRKKNTLRLRAVTLSIRSNQFTSTEILVHHTCNEKQGSALVLGQFQGKAITGHKSENTALVLS